MTCVKTSEVKNERFTKGLAAKTPLVMDFIELWHEHKKNTCHEMSRHGNA